MVNITEDQLSQLIQAVCARVDARPPPPPAAATTTSATTAVTVWGPTSWTDLAMLDLSKPDTIDAWFVAFEQKVRAARVVETRWAEKFNECPRVPQGVKSRIPTDSADEYKKLRLAMLKEYGPLNPVGYFRAQLYAVKGATRDVVRRRLEELLTLYNRAAADHNGPEFTKMDLIYPFIQAFPPAITADLQRDLGFALGQVDPLEQLFHRAPVGPVGSLQVEKQAEEASTLLAVARPSGSGKKRQRVEVESSGPTTSELAAAITEMSRSIGKLARRCSGCGGQCEEKEQCPAFGKACHNCGGRDHFASACRSRNQRAGGFQRSQQRQRGFQRNSNFVERNQNTHCDGTSVTDL